MSIITKKEGSALRRQGSMSSLDYSSLAIGESRNKNKQQIQALVQKFNEINEQVVLEGDQAHFNLVSYERENQKIKYDPQMMAAKLRKLENRAQINRAQRQIDNREKKKMKRLSLQKQKEMGKTYRTIYEQFLKDNKLTHDLDQFSEDESTQNKNNHKGVSFFKELKRHPVLLQYTLQKINDKEKQDEQRVKKLQNTLTKMRKQNSEVSPEYKQLLQDFNKKLIQMNQQNPQSIIEARFSKFYSKKSSDKLTSQVRNIPRCSKMIEKQNQIVSQIKENSLSKQNKLKLKSRLNEIITSISKTQKFNSVTFPKLQSHHHKENEKKQ